MLNETLEQDKMQDEWMTVQQQGAVLSLLFSLLPYLITISSLFIDHHPYNTNDQQ